MANQKITDLVQIETISSDDVLPIVDISDNITKKIDITQIKAQSPVQSVNATTGDVTVQATLVSGTNIKTINSTSILGSGNLVVAGTPSGVSGAVQFSDGSAFASDATNFFWDDTNDRLGIGTASPNAALDVSSTTQGFLPPRMTTAQRDAIATPATGLVVYNTSTNSHNFYNGTAWKALAVASGVAGQVQFSDGTNLASTGNLFWRSDTNRLGINVASVANTFDVNGNAYIGNNSNSGSSARLSVKGAGSTTATINTQWTNSANSGIGNLNDAGNISFTGKASFGNAGSTSILNVKGSGATSATSSVSVINSASTSLLYVGDDGKIGVGTSAPTAKLEIIGSGVTNATSSLLVKNSGSTVIVRSYDSGGFATGTSSLATGQSSFATGESSIASGTRSVVLGEGTASGTTSLAGGGGTASGNSSFSFGNGCTSSGAQSVVLGWFSSSPGSGSLATGSKSNAYYFSARTHAAVVIGAAITSGAAQWSESHFALKAALTTGGTSFLLTGDASETTASKLIPNGDNRVWNVKLTIVSVVSLITGTATGVTVGDIYMENQYLCFSKLGGVSSVFGTVDKTNQKNSASLSTMLFDVIPNVTNQSLQIQVTAPTFAGGGSVTLTNSCKIEFTEVAY